MARGLEGRRPKLIGGLVSAMVLACLVFAATALAAGDTGKSWGYNGGGNLGDGTTTGSNLPVTISGLSNATQISAGMADHVLARLADGTVMGWGPNYGGQLGQDNTGPDDCGGGSACSTEAVAISGLSGVVQVAAGNAHSLALLSDGTVKAWGRNYAGQLGRDDTGLDDCGGGDPCSLTPLTVAGLSNVVAIAAGGSHNLALLADGTVMAWGNNSSGQLGDGDPSGPDDCAFYTCATTPQAVPGLTDVVGISAGNEHSVALLADGTVQAWGTNSYAELGNGSSSSTGCACVSSPAAVSGATDAISVSAGYHHTLALQADGHVIAWGDNESGAIGNGTITTAGCSCVPVATTVGTLSGVTEATAGGYHSLALLTDGTVKAWGADYSGELGNGHTGGAYNTGVPVDVSNLTGATGLGSGYSSSYALVGPSQTLTVSMTGLGAGKVVGPGISCPPVCSHAYPQGASVILRALPDPDAFNGFSGACTGTDPCGVTLDVDRTVGAQFGAPKPAEPTPPGTAPAGPTGKRAKAVAKCKRKHGKKRKKCLKRAHKLPV